MHKCSTKAQSGSPRLRIFVGILLYAEMEVTEVEEFAQVLLVDPTGSHSSACLICSSGINGSTEPLAYKLYLQRSSLLHL